MREREVRAAVIGLGRMGMRHLEALRQIGVPVDSVADLDESKLAAVPGVPACSRWVDLLDTRRPSLLIIATHADTHAEITIEGAARGAHAILCEKPMATSVHDAQAMIAACRTHGVRLAVNYGRRYHDGYRRLRDLVTAGAIGPLRQIHITCGGGRLGGNGAHFFDLVTFFMPSPPRGVFGQVRSHGLINPRGAHLDDPGGFGVILFEDGARAFIDMSEDLAVTPRYELAGTFGRVTIDEMERDWRVSARSAADRNAPAFVYDLPMAPVVFDSGDPVDVVSLTSKAIEELLSEKPVSASGEDGLKALELYAAVRQSGELGGRLIELPLDEATALRRWRIT